MIILVDEVSGNVLNQEIEFVFIDKNVQIYPIASLVKTPQITVK